MMCLEMDLSCLEKDYQNFVNTLKLEPLSNVILEGAVIKHIPCSD